MCITHREAGNIFIFRYMKNIFLIFSSFFFMFCTNRNTIVNKDELFGYDYRLFQETPVWELAKAVWDEDVDEIEHIVMEEKADINYPEPRFGQTLLMLTIQNNDFKSFQKLLELKANPNLYDESDGRSAIIIASGFNGFNNDGVRFLKLLLKYGANPNDLEIGKRRKGSYQRLSPLLAASSESLEKVEILIQYGAKINFKNEFGSTALHEAVTNRKYDIVLYLMKNGADYESPLFNRNGQDIYIVDLLKDDNVPLVEEKLEQKEKVIEFLKSKGLKY